MSEEVDSGTAQHDSIEQELLSFRVGDAEYSVDIMTVREIRGWTRATSLPHAPSYVRGVINLRGAVLPVIDLALRLGLPVEELHDRNVIIVVDVDGRNVGIRVDAVSDILAVPKSALQQPPDMNSDRDYGFVQALTIVDGRMIRILDLGAVVPSKGVAAA